MLASPRAPARPTACTASAPAPVAPPACGEEEPGGLLLGLASADEREEDARLAAAGEAAEHARASADEREETSQLTAVAVLAVEPPSPYKGIDSLVAAAESETAAAARQVEKASAAEALRAAETMAAAEGLQLARTLSSASGFKGVYHKGSYKDGKKLKRPYQAKLKGTTLGTFMHIGEAALCVARAVAGRTHNALAGSYGVDRRAPHSPPPLLPPPTP